MGAAGSSVAGSLFARHLTRMVQKLHPRTRAAPDGPAEKPRRERVTTALIVTAMPDAIIDALGRRFALRFAAGTDAALEGAVRRAWTGAQNPDSSTPPDGAIDVPLADTSPERVLSDLSATVTRRAIEHRRGELWMVHAGGVADENGRVCMLVGPSGAGKTTATRRLSRRFAYVSDETVAVADDGQVTPYRKPLSLVVSGEAWKRQLAPEELGLGTLPDAPLQLGVVLVLDRSADAPTVPRAIPLDTLSAITAVAEHSSGLASMPTPLATIAAHLRRAPAFRLWYRDDTDLAPIVRALLDDPGVRRGSDDVYGEGRPAAITARPATYRSAPVVDALRGDDDVLVLRRAAQGDGLLTRLSGIAPVIWRTCRSGAERAEIVAAVTAAFGPPPTGESADELTRAALDVLCASGVIEAGVSATSR